MSGLAVCFLSEALELLLSTRGLVLLCYFAYFKFYMLKLRPILVGETGIIIDSLTFVLFVIGFFMMGTNKRLKFFPSVDYGV